MLILIQEAAIWHRWTIFCGGAVKEKCYADKPERQLNIWSANICDAAITDIYPKHSKKLTKITPIEWDTMRPAAIAIWMK